MTVFDKLFRLSKSLAKSILKKEESTDLHDYNDFSQETKQKIADQLSEPSIQYNLKQMREIDTDEDWKKVQSKIESDNSVKSSSRFRKFIIYRLAAAALLILSLSYLLMKGQLAESSNNTSANMIEAGSNRAVLTLQNGTQISLNETTILDSLDLLSDGERLQYKEGSANNDLEFNYLTVPRGGQYQLVLSDGSQMWLNADTQVRYPAKFKRGMARQVELLYGEVYLDVSSSQNNHGDSFMVMMKDQTIEVLGTQFNVKAYKDDSAIYTTLVEGSIALINPDGQNELLQPNEQAILNLEMKDLQKSKVNADHHISWIKGYFNFQDKSLADITKTLSRWYDIDFVFEKSELKHVSFSGLLSRRQNIQDILNAIKNTKTIDAYEIRNRIIFIK